MLHELHPCCTPPVNLHRSVALAATPSVRCLQRPCSAPAVISRPADVLALDIALMLQAAPALLLWTSCDALDVLDAKLLGPPRQEFIELRLGGPDNLVLQHLYQPVD